ncbi:MAG: MmcB family DNA repair protein [Magnetovibrionaceae bacterium]
MELFDPSNPPPAPEAISGVAASVCRGVMRFLDNLGYAPLAEVRLNNHRRVDVMGLNAKGQIIVCEIKSSVADFRADSKWPEYLDYCDQFFFAVAPDFPRDILPSEEGLIIADSFGADIVRPSVRRKVNGTRRKTITLTFARTAARRLLWQAERSD